MSRWFSLRYWWRLGRRIMKLLASPRIPLREKLLFTVPVIVYWVMPDALPFLPIDDVAVTMFVASWFAERMESKYGGELHGNGQSHGTSDGAANGKNDREDHES